MLGQGLPLQTCIGAGATNKAHKSYAAQHTRLGAAGPAKMQRLAGFMSHGSSGERLASTGGRIANIYKHSALQYPACSMHLNVLCYAAMLAGGLWQGCHRAWACRSQGLSRPLASTPQAVATGAWAGKCSRVAAKKRALQPFCAITFLTSTRTCINMQ